jgi:hypothetical protein
MSGRVDLNLVCVEPESFHRGMACHAPVNNRIFSLSVKDRRTEWKSVS